jgi:hypothetical protein
MYVCKSMFICTWREDPPPPALCQDRKLESAPHKESHVQIYLPTLKKAHLFSLKGVVSSNSEPSFSNNFRVSNFWKLGQYAQH